MERFPQVSSLANASEDEVLKLWQGLGYYSRARNLHFASKQIMQEFGGIFPSEYKLILKLKGIGTYTAAAISSFAFHLPHAVVDGNVYRLLSRYFGISTPIDSSEGIKEFAELANSELDKSKPGTHNQAIMEFGAIQCTPLSPDCSSCPLSVNCFAFKNELTAQLPVKVQKTKVKRLFFNYFQIENKHSETLLHQRTEKGIWKNLWEFPLLESDHLLSAFEIGSNNLKVAAIIGDEFTVSSISKPYRHLLSHREIHAQFIKVEVAHLKEGNAYKCISKDSLPEYAISRLTERYLEEE